MRVLLLSVLAAALPCTVGAQPTSRLVGRVSSADTDRPIAGVAVTLNDVTVTTDARGAFTFAAAPTGTHVLRFEMLSYQTRTDTIAIAEGETTEIAVRLSQNPIALPRLLVHVRSRWLETNGYYERRFESGLSGRYIDRAEIERRNPTYLTDLFRDVSGARVEQGFSRRVIRFNREKAGGLMANTMPADGFEQWLVRLRGCQPALFIDGRPHRDRIIRDHGSYVDDFNAISPAIIDAIEVYVGANTPTEFRDTSGCGVILIWTRRGG